MRHLAGSTGGSAAGTAGIRAGRLLGTAVLLAGGLGAAVLLGGGAAEAAACGTATAAGTACTLTGTLGVTAGTLTMTSPTALAWTTAPNGLDQQVVDPTAAQQSYLINDATGSGAGWHVTISATTFTATGPLTLPNTGTFVTTGSITSEAAATAPTAACSTTSTCTLPTDTTTYPVAITTATTGPPASTIYDTSAGTGLGSITIGIGALPVGWWVNVPSNTKVGSYTSTISLTVVSAP
jgi:hypothetical protein